MKNQVKGENGAAVLEELIRQLKKNENVCRMLGDLNAHDPDVLVAQLVEELERIIKWRHLQHELLAKPPAPPPPPPPGTSELQRAPKPEPEPESDLKPESKPPEKPEPQPQPEPIPPAEAPIVRRTSREAELPEKVTIPEAVMQTSEQEHLDSEESEAPIRKQVPRVPSELGTDDYLYLHGVTRVGPEETSSTSPFLLEEKGIDNRSFAFALDYQGLRFYGSKLSRESISLTSNGVLLLSKQENIRMRGAHEGILNDLRLHGILLPFEFGTVFSGPEEMKSKIKASFAEIRDALDELLKTRWWNLSAYALDSRTAELVGQAAPGARRETDRGRVPYSAPAAPKRIDVKTLERILNKQKKAAESIHAALQPFAERSDVDMMVSLQSGSSDDWKIILKASYELGPSMLIQFVRTVTDLQYQHFLMELMLSLSGNVEAFSFPKS